MVFLLWINNGTEKIKNQSDRERRRGAFPSGLSLCECGDYFLFYAFALCVAFAVLRIQHGDDFFAANDYEISFVEQRFLFDIQRNFPTLAEPCDLSCFVHASYRDFKEHPFLLSSGGKQKRPCEAGRL
jgi:hypothetical protein